MAFTITSQTNQLYSERVEGLTPDQKARVGLAQNSTGLDGAAKAFGAWDTPQYRLIGQTTAAENGDFTLNLATSVRTVIDPLASPSLQNTIQLGPLAGILTAGTSRLIRFRVKQTTAGVVNIFWCAQAVAGGATPALGAAPLTTSVLGSKQNAADIVVLQSGVGSLTVRVTAGGAVTTVWQVDVFTDDQV